MTSTQEVKRSKRETGEADSDSYEEYKSDEENIHGGGRGVAEEVDKVEIISQQKAVDGITGKDDAAKKETGDKKKEKKKREKHSKHALDEEGGEIIGGQEKKERKKEKKTKEGKKEKKSKEQKGEEKAAKVKKEKAPEERKEIRIEEVQQKGESETVEKPKEIAEEETKPTEAAIVSVTAATPETTSSDVTVLTVVDKVTAHPVATTLEVSVPEPVKEEAPIPAASTELLVSKEAEEKAAPPPSETPVPVKANETVAPHVVHPEAAPSEAAAAKPTLTQTAQLPADEASREPVKEEPAAEVTPITITEPTQPSSDTVVTKPRDLPPQQSDVSDQAKAYTKEVQAGPQPPRGVEQILEHARKEAELNAAGSSRLLMAKSLVARQEKLQEQLTNIRHEFGDIDSEIRALKIDCYRNQRAFAKHH